MAKAVKKPRIAVELLTTSPTSPPNIPLLLSTSILLLFIKLVSSRDLLYGTFPCFLSLLSPHISVNWLPAGAGKDTFHQGSHISRWEPQTGTFSHENTTTTLAQYLRTVIRSGARLLLTP